MHRTHFGRLAVLAAAVATLAGCAGMSGTDRSGTTFFVTSAGSGRGGDLGGLKGADAQCQKLADAAGAGKHTWRAYLSTQPSNSTTGVNARDRIGKGPWQNAKGVVVARDVAQLHGDNNITKATALTEKGEVVNGRGDTPNEHDILTGSQPDGTFIAGSVNSTCANWEQSEGGAAMLGHSDRTGLDDSVPAKSWNSSHQSRGCSPAQLATTGSSGRLYCFAAD